MRRILYFVVLVGLTGAAAGFGTHAAFFKTTGDGSNNFAAGTVNISDNDGGSGAVVSVTGDGGSTSSGCIVVTSSGSLTSGVRLYGTVSGTLLSYLTLTVTRGTQTSPSFSSCTTPNAFVADATNYIGSGAGVIWTGNAASFPANWSAGVVDPTAAWATNEAHVYKFAFTIASNNAAQGTSATASFTWEARNT